ncbi:Uncharacterised protein [Bordetella pertussis]|nr:Uncharacterised protein [Bordetella pertussis]
MRGPLARRVYRAWGKQRCRLMVHPPGIEPGRLAARDFKSLASTNFAMGAAVRQGDNDNVL